MEAKIKIIHSNLFLFSSFYFNIHSFLLYFFILLIIFSINKYFFLAFNHFNSIFQNFYRLDITYLTIKCLGCILSLCFLNEVTLQEYFLQV